MAIFSATRYAFSLYALPTAATSALILLFGVRVLLRGTSRVTTAFFGMTFAASVWLAAFTMMYCSRDDATAIFWARLAYLGVPMLAPSIYRFAVEMLHISQARRLFTLASWMLAIFFSSTAVSTGLLITRVQHYGWGFYPRYGGALTIPFLVFFFGFLAAALVEFLRAYPTARGMERPRIRMMLIAFAVAYLGCVDYLPKFGIDVYPFGYLPILGFVMIAGTAFRRYDIVAITPSLAAPEIINTMADALFVCDREGQIQLANAAAERLLGYGQAELVGRRIEDLLAPSNDATLANGMRRRTIRTEEHVFLGKGGQRVELMISIAPVVDKGEAAGAIMIGRDMRERKEAERQIRKAVTLLESTLDSTADGIIVVSAGGRVLTYNNRFVEMWRLPKELMDASHDRLIIASVLNQLSDPDEFLRTLDALNAQPEAESFDLLHFKDGRRFERYSSGRIIEDVPMRVWSFRDVTARYTAESAMRESELRYRLLFEQNAAGVCVTSLDGDVIECNVTFASMLGYSRAELAGTKATDLYVRPLERDEIIAMLHDVSTLNSVEVEMRRKDGSTAWVLQNVTLSANVVHVTMVDISDRRRAEEQIEFHAYHDVLTNLPNRKLFMDRLSQALTRCRRYGKSLAVMFVDLDHFKTINDTLGHTGGDELLLEMSRRLRECIRDDDTVARLGGDEFTIILSELRYPEDAANVAQKILTSIERPLSIGSTPIEVSASIGIALFPADGHDAESLLRNADSAMYRAKEAGRNTFQLCTDDMKRRAVERLSLETRLRRAVHDGQLLLHYQPQISLATGKIIGVEALVRWDDPERGIVHPSAFIPVAEESRLILPLGEWVLRTACAQMREWRERRLDVPYVSVNLSARQFQQHDLVDLVRRTLEESGLDGSALELEVTETTAMQNADVTLDVLHALRELGVGIAIDDFGTGYSSLNYLKRFPITCVKIDRIFVRDIDAGESDAAIVAAIIDISRNLRLRVVAEGVETDQQASFLRRHKCDAAQGYLFGRPVSAERIPFLTQTEPRRQSGSWLSV